MLCGKPRTLVIGAQRRNGRRVKIRGQWNRSLGKPVAIIGADVDGEVFCTERRPIAQAVEHARKRLAAGGDRIGNSRVGRHAQVAKWRFQPNDCGA